MFSFTSSCMLTVVDQKPTEPWPVSWPFRFPFRFPGRLKVLSIDDPHHRVFLRLCGWYIIAVNIMAYHHGINLDTYNTILYRSKHVYMSRTQSLRYFKIFFTLPQDESTSTEINLFQVIQMHDCLADSNWDADSTNLPFPRMNAGMLRCNDIYYT